MENSSILLNAAAASSVDAIPFGEGDHDVPAVVPEEVHPPRDGPPDVAVGDDPHQSPVAVDNAGHPQPLQR